MYRQVSSCTTGKCGGFDVVSSGGAMLCGAESTSGYVGYVGSLAESLPLPRRHGPVSPARPGRPLDFETGPFLAAALRLHHCIPWRARRVPTLSAPRPAPARSAQTPLPAPRENTPCTGFLSPAQCHFFGGRPSCLTCGTGGQGGRGAREDDATSWEGWRREGEEANKVVFFLTIVCCCNFPLVPAPSTLGTVCVVGMYIHSSILPSQY